jgi:ubiquinone/menaquinone biosynthesis C-methylase UbiE
MKDGIERKMTLQSLTELDQEIERLETEYRRRDAATISASRYSLFNEAALLHSQSLERHLLSLLKRHKFTDLREKRLLDVGCGNGSHLRRFVEYGVIPSNAFGIDLMAHRIEQAQRINPSIHWKVGSAHQLPYTDASFDLVVCNVVFSSILSEQLRQMIANEMWRVHKSGGLILIHDFVYSNPRNTAVRGITLRRIKHLFNRTQARFDFRHIVLAPPISRFIAPRTYWLASTLEQLRICNTHIIGVISSDQVDGVAEKGH